MAENSQLSDTTNSNSTDTSSTDTSSVVIGNHENAIVPHKISNHDKLVQTMVMVDGEWINVNDTNDQANMKEDMHNVNQKVVEAQKGIVEAKNTAESAVNYANSAVSASKVNSDAIAAQSSAISEAKAATDSAMSRAESAWDVATNAKSAVTDFDPLLKSAQSDASKALTQIADTASALSDAKTEFGSDVAEAKGLANTAQTTANNAVESAGENAKALASQANALSDAKKAIDSDVASAKGLANAAQATADNAVKSASSVAGDLAAVASQAKSNASGITKVTSDVGLLQTTVADNSGNISKIQETAKQIQQAVSDNAGNITTAKQTADSAATVASDAKSNATVAVQTASGASVTAKDAQGDATTAITTANSAVTQASDAKSNATIAVQTASEASVTATNAQGDASIAKQTASDASVQIKNAQGDISALQTRAGKIEASVTTNSGAIADVQATANQLKASVADNSGNITTTKQTADSAVTVASDARSNATVAIQTASQASITANNASGQAASAVLTANGALTTASDAKSDATVAIQTASGASLTATNAQGDATIAKQTASEAIVQASNADSDFAQISIRANKIEANVATNSGAIASVQQTANGLTTTVADIKANGGGVNLVQNTSSTAAAFDSSEIMPGVNKIVTIGHWLYGNIKANTTYTMHVTLNFDNATGSSPTFDYQLRDGNFIWSQPNFYESPLQSIPTGVVQSFKYAFTFNMTNPSSNGYELDIRFNNLTGGTVSYQEVMIEEGTVAHDWSPAPEDLQNQFTQIKQSIDGVTTTINDPKTGLNATYQTAAGNSTTISSVKGDVAQLQTTANGLTSRVGSLESKTDTQQTAIEQNKTAIALKVDQTDVNTLKGTVNQNTATLKTQADNIQSKVSASDVTGMLTGYATQSYTQSLVTQKANEWNLNLTSLKTDVNAIKTTGGGVNLWIGSKSFQQTNVNAPEVDWSTDSDGIVTAHITGTGGFYGKWQYIYANNTDPFSIGDSGTFSIEMKGTGTITIGRENDFQKSVTLTDTWTRYSVSGVVNHKNSAHIIYNESGQNCDAYVRLPMVENGTVAHTWSPAPSDMATVTSVTNLSATIDGLKSTVASYKDGTSSQFTQLSNAIQSKVGTDDFNNLKQAVGLQTLESADINNMKTNGHYFVHNLANNPIGGWVYVDVTGDGSSRIRQDVYQDNGSQHKYRRWVDTNWTGWEEGATYTEINQLCSDINLRVTKGDLLSQINLEAGQTLIQSGKIYFDADSFVMSPNSEAFIPSAYITDINADKITTGTLDASKLHVENFSADNIDGGTLESVVLKTGTGDQYFKTSQNNIYWVKKDGTSLIGNDTYLNDGNGLTIADTRNLFLTTWGGATVNGDNIINNSGSYGHPRIVIDREGKYNPDAPGGETFGGGPGDNEIAQWVGNKEYTVLTRGKGLTVQLNDENKNSVFVIQKDNKVGFYVGGGDDGNEIRIAGAGPIKLQGKYIDDGFDDGITHNLGNLQVDNLHVRKWLGVDQSKNAIVKTSQGPITINAYETAEYYFGDIGEGQTSADGIAYIGIEKLFNETVNTTIPYHVFITAYGPGNIWVDQREHNRFIVKSDQPNLKFSWEIKAKRKGYEHTRLQNVDDKLNHMAATS
ncbi:hypothetical protein [Limosilactobacillus reuteri]|uniref:hypothetical protein n=1 Tax=Limosilactobacillus reuteri TaxID=1598 RepID=UPI002F26B5EA